MIEHRRARPVLLRQLSLDEKWLQDRIEEDPSILGLGNEVKLWRRERRQASGGRLDFVLEDEDEERRYEVEVMLGSVDESHIIRTIEYWDIERQKYKEFDHRAVIVAEEITARFYNVIRLLNRAVPLIALQMSALPIEDNKAVILHFARVLDIYDEVQDAAEESEGDQGDPVDRTYWEKRGGKTSLGVLDKIVALIQEKIGTPKVTYNKISIAIGTSGYHFCWVTPRSAGHCHTRLKATTEARDELVKKFAGTNLYVRPFMRRLITLKLTDKELEDNKPLIEELFKICEEQSRSA